MTAEWAAQFECERCREPLFSGGGPPGYCALCRRFECRACYGSGDARRCAACKDRTWRGARNASAALTVLQGASEELGGLVASPAGSADEPVRLALLDLKIESAREAALVALAARGPHLPAKIEELRSELLLTEARIAALREDLDRRIEPAAPAAAADDAERGYGRALFVGAAAAVVLLNVAAVAWLLSRPSGDDQVVVATQAPRGDVAGGAPTPGQAGGATRPAESRPSELIGFDDLETNAEIADGWAVEPEGAATTAAFPTAIDRSARLAPAAVPTTLCRTLESPARSGLGVSVEVFVEAGVTDALLVELRTADRPLLSLVRRSDGGVFATGEMLSSEAMLGVLDNEGWHLLSVDVTEAGVEARLDGGDRDVTASAEMQADPATLQVDAICFGLPADAGGDLYIDDVSID